MNENFLCKKVMVWNSQPKGNWTVKFRAAGASTGAPTSHQRQGVSDNKSRGGGDS